MQTEYEYVVDVSVTNGRKYRTTIGKSYEEVQEFIEMLEEKYQTRGNKFYIENDFYDNQLNVCKGGTSYKFFCRPIGAWEALSKEKINEIKNNSRNSCNVANNVIYLDTKRTLFV